MKSATSKNLGRILLAATLVAAPVSLGMLSIDTALAAKGGNGGGHGGGNGNGNNGNHGNGNGASSHANKTGSAKASTAKTTKAKATLMKKAAKEKQPNMASQLGALNAAHASARAFAHASPNSRVGRIAAYAAASSASTAAQDKVTQAEAGVQAAQDALDADPTNADLQKALADAQQALTDSQTALTDAQIQSSTLLEAAANKHPVTPEMQIAVDNLLAGKIPPPEPEAN